MEAVIFKRFWTDPDMEEQPPEIKLCALWLVTNPRVTSYGFSETTDRRFVFETSLPSDTLQRALESLPRTFKAVGKGVWVRNYIRYQVGDGPSLVNNNIARSIVKELERSQERDLVRLIYDEYPALHQTRDLFLLRGFGAPSKGQEQSRADKSRAEGKGESGENRDLDALQSAIGSIFGRKKNHPWSYEEKELLGHVTITAEQIELLRAYYAAPADDSDLLLKSRKQKVVTMLRDLGGELDRAEGWAKKNRPSTVVTQPEPKGWREKLKAQYPDSPIPMRFSDLTPDLRREIS